MQTLVQIVKEHAENIPDKKAVLYRKESISYGELYHKAAKAAAALKKKGIEKGDRILLEAGAKTDFVITFLAVQMIGAVTVPLARAEKVEILEYVSEVVQSRLFICSAKCRSENIHGISYKELFAEVSGDAYEEYEIPNESEPLEIIFTTGSTGKPKGTVHTASAISCNMDNTRNGIGMREDDIVLIPLPLNHSFALRVLRSTFMCGGTVVLQNSAVSAKELEDNMRSHHCTGMISVNAALDTLLKNMGEDKMTEILSGLRYLEVSAGSLEVGMRKKLSKMLKNTEIHNTWGSSESGGCFFINIKERPDKITSMGKPLDNIKCRIVDEQGKEITERRPQNVGKLAIKGDMLMDGYYGQKELTNQVLVDGWLILNDLVWRDEDGYLYMVGRADDMINVGGEKVAPKEIEEVAMNIKGVSECLVVGMDDEAGSMGQIPVMCFVPSENDSAVRPERIKEVISHQLPAYKVPQKIISMSVIPRNAMGKPDRKKLKRQLTVKSSFSNEVINNILKRRSIRKFEEREIPQNIMDILLECGKSAPSGKNLKTRRFTVIMNRKEIEKLKELVLDVTREKGISASGFENPQAVILVSNDRRNQDGIQDVSCSVENMMLAAHSLGLGSVWLNSLMTICDDPCIREKLNEYHIPKNHIVWSMLALGYPLEPGVEPEQRGNEVFYVQ